MLITRVITAQSIITNVNKSLYVTIAPAPFLSSGGWRNRPFGSLGKHIILSMYESPLKLWDGLGIICLTRQPIRKVKSSRSGDIAYLSRAAYLTRTERLYLFFRFRIATISSATVKITMNSSYVLISTTPFRKTRNGVHSRPIGCLGKHIILSMYDYILQLSIGLLIICLTRKSIR